MSTSTTAAIPRERTRTQPKPPHRSVTHTILGLLVKLVVLVLLVIVIYPLFWLVTGSFKTQNEFITQPIWSLPSHLNWGNYTAARTTGHMGIYLRNSILAVLPSLVLIVILRVATGFALEVMIFRAGPDAFRTDAGNAFRGGRASGAGATRAVRFVTGWFRPLPGRSGLEAQRSGSCPCRNGFARSRSRRRLPPGP